MLECQEMHTITPAVILAILATIIPEASTGSTPISIIATPLTFLILFIAYGLAVLLIREFAVRMQIGVGGLLLLGIAYGLLNEGLFAKTLLRETLLPMAEYDNYSYHLGINIAFALAITLWHAVSSVIFPIMATHVLFPDVRDRPWIGKNAALALALVVSLASLLFHFDDSNAQFPVGTWMTAVLFFASICALIVLALRYRVRGGDADEHGATGLGPFWLGVSTFFFLFLILTEFIAKGKAPIAAFLSVYAVGIWLYVRTLTKKHWRSPEGILLFSLGSYIPVIVMGVVLGVQGPMPVERIATELVFLFGTIWLVRRTLARGVRIPKEIGRG